MYEYQAAAPRQGVPEYLSNFVHGKDKAKLFRRDSAGGPKGLSQSGPIARPKVTHLATKVRLAYHPKGTKLHFLDAASAEIAAFGMDFPDKWTCANDRLERKSQRTGGLGEVLQTHRVEETLARDANGDLVYTETVTRVDPPGGKPERTEARFRRAQAVG